MNTKRQAAARCRARGRAIASAADLDDLIRIHLRMPSALVRHRFGRCRPPCPRLNRDWRNDRRVGNRNLSYPGDFLRDRAAVCVAKRENATGENHENAAEGRAGRQSLDGGPRPHAKRARWKRIRRYFFNERT